jgi:hypothetical protein
MGVSNEKRCKNKGEQNKSSKTPYFDDFPTMKQFKVLL